MHSPQQITQLANRGDDATANSIPSPLRETLQMGTVCGKDLYFNIQKQPTGGNNLMQGNDPI